MKTFPHLAAFRLDLCLRFRTGPVTLGQAVIGPTSPMLFTHCYKHRFDDVVSFAAGWCSALLPRSNVA